MAVAVSQCLTYSLVEWLIDWSCHSCKNSLQEQIFNPWRSCCFPKFKKLSVLSINVLSLSFFFFRDRVAFLDYTYLETLESPLLLSLWICEMCVCMRVCPSSHWVEFISCLDTLCAALPACCWLCRTFTFSEMTSVLILWINYFVYRNL